MKTLYNVYKRPSLDYPHKMRVNESSSCWRQDFRGEIPNISPKVHDDQNFYLKCMCELSLSFDKM